MAVPVLAMPELAETATVGEAFGVLSMPSGSAKTLRGLSVFAKPLSSAKLGKKGIAEVYHDATCGRDEKNDGKGAGDSQLAELMRWAVGWNSRLV